MFRYKIKNSKRLPNYNFQGFNITSAEWLETEVDLLVDKIDFILKEELPEPEPIEFKLKPIIKEKPRKKKSKKKLLREVL